LILSSQEGTTGLPTCQAPKYNIQADRHARKRLVGFQQRSLDDGKLSMREPTGMAIDPTFISGDGGLFSTVPEYLTLLIPLVNQGIAANGVQILKPETVKEMLRDQLTQFAVTGLSLRPCTKDPIGRLSLDMDCHSKSQWRSLALGQVLVVLVGLA